MLNYRVSVLNQNNKQTSVQTFLRNRFHVPWTHFLSLTIVPPNNANEEQQQAITLQSN